MKILRSLAAFSLLAVMVSGCGNSGSTPENASSTGSETSNVSTGEKVAGKISMDGSSTVGPVSEAMAEAFTQANPDVQMDVAVSGTGGGFKKFAAGEIDIAGASRPIEDKEIEACKEKGIEFVEIPIAFDGLSVVVNPENNWVEDITVAELKKIWEPKSTVKTWKDVNAAWPAEPIKLYGPGTDSGTFDYFTKAVNGKEKESRSDYQASEDDNTLVTGVSGDKGGLGYFGYAYYEQNKDKLKVLKVGGVAPSPESIGDGTYTPLSRPLFWYVNTKSLDRPEVQAFLKFALGDGTKNVSEAGYIALPAEAYKLAMEHITSKKTGTAFKGAQPGMKIEDILKAEKK